MAYVLGPISITGSTLSLNGTLQASEGSTVASNYPIAVTGSTLYSTMPAGGTGVTGSNSIFFGEGTGTYSSSSYANFIGYFSGFLAKTCNYSNFIGHSAGYYATNAQDSNFIGYQAGKNSSQANSSVFIGSTAGMNAGSASQATFVGNAAGFGSLYAGNATFIGNLAGYGATEAYQSVCVGDYAGYNAASSSYSILIGRKAGYKVNGTGIKSNNIIIGSNLSLPNGTQNAINIGAAIFATDIYDSYNAPSTIFSGSVSAKVGINQPSPQYTLDVSGSVGISTLLNISASHPLPAGVVGHLAVSASHLWFYNGAWTQLD